MTSRTTGNISTLNFMIGSSVDEVQLQQSTARIASVMSKAKAEMDLKALSKSSRSYEAPPDVAGGMSNFLRSQEQEASEIRQREMQVRNAEGERWLAEEIRRESQKVQQLAADEKWLTEQLERERAERYSDAQRYAGTQLAMQGRERPQSGIDQLRQQAAAAEALADEAGQTRMAALNRMSAALQSQHDAEMRYHAEESEAAERENAQWIQERARRQVFVQGALSTQREEERRFHDEQSAAAERENAQWLTMMAARRNADPYSQGNSPIASGGERIADQIAEEQRLADLQETANRDRLAGILQAVDAEQRVGLMQQAQAEDAERRAAQRVAGIMGAVNAEIRLGQAQEDAVNNQINAVQRDLNRELVRGMTIEQRINHEYQQRLLAIDAIQGATAQQTAELVRQAGLVRDQANSFGGGAGRLGGRIQEFGRGFEDFTIGFSMAKTNVEGIAMGLRGSANNAAQLAASFNPIVGASVAIGASLATVIVPMVARWLWDTEALEKAQDKWNEKLKESGEEQIKVSEALAKMRGIIRDDKDAKPEEKGKDIAKEIKDAERKSSDAAFDASEKQKAKVAADARAREARARLKDVQDNETVLSGRWIKEAPLKKDLELAEEESRASSDALSKADKDKQTASEEERRLKTENAGAIAKAESDIKLTAAQKTSEELDKRQKASWDAQANEFDKIEERRADIEKQHAKDVKEIKDQKFAGGKDKDGKDIDEEALIRKADLIRSRGLEKTRQDQKKLEEKAAAEREAEMKRSNAVQQQLDKDGDKNTNAKFDDINRHHDELTERIKKDTLDEDLMKKRLEQNQSNREVALQKEKKTRFLDDAIRANEEEQQKIKDRLELRGENQNKSSAALAVGTQTAESVIAKALVGQSSVDDTDKKQLRVLEKIERNIRKEKDKTVRL